MKQEIALNLALQVVQAEGGRGQVRSHGEDEEGAPWSARSAYGRGQREN